MEIARTWLSPSSCYFAGNRNFLFGLVDAFNDHGVVDLWHLAIRKPNVYNGTNDLCNVANVCFSAVVTMLAPKL